MIKCIFNNEDGIKVFERPSGTGIFLEFKGNNASLCTEDARELIKQLENRIGK